MKKSLLACAVLGLALSAPTAYGFDYLIPANDSQAFQDALDDAATNMQDDVITLAAGTYLVLDEMIPRPFGFFSLQPNSLKIQGAGVGKTILDGREMSGILSLSNFEGMTNKSIEVSGISFQNGAALGDHIGTEGGGLHISMRVPSQVNVSDCSFHNNRALRGGGMAVEGSDDPGPSSFQGTFSNLDFEDNHTTTINGISETQSFGGGFFLNIRGIYDVSFDRIRAVGNSSVGSDGGGAVINNPRILSNANQLSLTNSYFENNQANISAGGFAASDTFADVTITNNIFLKNVVSLDPSVADDFDEDLAPYFPQGGGVAFYITSGVLQVVHNTIAGNRVETKTEGGIVTSGFGGGLCVMPFDDFNNRTLDTLNIYNNIIRDNQAGNGRDIAVLAPVLDDISLVDAETPSLFPWSGLEEGIQPLPAMGNGPLAFNLYNNDFGDLFNCDDLLPCGITQTFNEGGNIDLDPLFANFAANDVHLTAGSPAIDTGNVDAPIIPPMDFDGNLRPYGIDPDMGALEAVPDIEVTPLSHNFGTLDVDDSASVEILIANVGAGALNVTNLTLQQNDDFSFNPQGGSDPCGSLSFVLQGGESCTITASFAPEVEGDQSNILDVSSNDPDEAVVPVSLLGDAEDDGFLEGSGLHCGLNPQARPMSALSWSLFALPFALWGIQRRRLN